VESLYFLAEICNIGFDMMCTFDIFHKLAGAGAGGGMTVAMAHQPHAMAQSVSAGPQGASNARTGATSAPQSASGLAADVVDKNNRMI